MNITFIPFFFLNYFSIIFYPKFKFNKFLKIIQLINSNLRCSQDQEPEKEENKEYHKNVLLINYS